MHYLCGSPAPKIKEFYLRRLTRLEPPYVLAIVAVFFGLAAFSTNHGFPHLFASLLYSHNLIYGQPNPFFGLAWSLEIEIQFYCLIPNFDNDLHSSTGKSAFTASNFDVRGCVSFDCAPEPRQSEHSWMDTVFCSWPALVRSVHGWLAAASALGLRCSLDHSLASCIFAQ